MKKRSLFVFALIALIAFAFISCKNEAKPPQEHEHTFEKEQSFDDTYHYHKATCEHTSEVKHKAEHTFGEWITITEATKTEEGKRERECSVCKYKQEENIPTTSKRAIKVKRVLDKTYDGETIVLTKDDIEYKGDVANVTIECKVKGSEDAYSPILPKNAGEYELKITISASGDIEEEYALEHFSIKKRTLNIGHSQFTSCYIEGECQTIFELNKTNSSGLVEKDGVLDKVSIKVLKDNTWEHGKEYDLYLEGSEKSETIELVSLIGDDAKNYDLENIEGKLDATLHCHSKTKIKCNSNTIYGYVESISDISYDDTAIEIIGIQDDFVANLADPKNEYKNYQDYQLTFAVKVNDTVVAEGHRVGTHYVEIPHEYKNADLIDQGTEAHLKINFIPNVAGYTDSEGKWICKEDNLEMKVSVNYTDIPEVSYNTRLLGVELKANDYFLMRHTINDDECSAILFEFEDLNLKTNISVFKINGSNLVDIPEDEKYHYYNISNDESCYIVIRVVTDGAGGMTIRHMG